MRVLMVTGDRRLLDKDSSAHARLEMQESAVESLDVVYWGKGSVWPRLPDGPFDVATSQDPFVRGIYAWIVTRRRGIRFNAQVHADLEVQSLVRRCIATFILRRADSVRVVSEKLKAQVLALGVRIPITVLPIFVDVSAFSSVVPREHAGKNILWIGRLEREKDPLLAIDVFQDVLREVPDARLTMIGDGSLRDAVAKYAANLPVQTFELTGWSNPITHLDTADVVLSTSPAESYGAVLFEALAARVPVVALDVGIAREAGGTIAPSRAALAETLVRVLKEGKRGHLNPAFVITKEEWKKRFRDSLA